MKAIQFHEFGDVDVLRLEDIPVPEPKQREVLIRVQAAGVNADTLQRKNQYIYTPSLPFTPGGEVSGTIEKLGEDVQSFSIGQRVVAFTTEGGDAEYALAPENLTVVLPNEIDDDYSGECNGLAFSPDEKKLYVTDSESGNILVFDVKADGTLENKRVFADMKVPGKEP